MPHIIIEYSANLDPSGVMPRLVDALHAAAAGIEAFPLAGLRTRTERRELYRIADGHADNAFVHVVLRIAHGRPLDVRKAAGETLFAVLCATVQPMLDAGPLAVSFEIQEMDPVLSFKGGNIREHLARRAG